MKIFEQLKLIIHIVLWRLNWTKFNPAYRPQKMLSEKFISGLEAAQKIPDAACVFSSGIAGNARCSAFFFSIKKHFQATQHPQNLTWINVGAQGGRGKVPGTVEEVAQKGLITRYISGHLETAKSQLKMAQAGDLEVHTLPQGVMSLSLEAQGSGEDSLLSEVGVHTFVDPRVGTGSIVGKSSAEQLVSPEGDQLRYRLPLIDIALISAPYADEEGNIYFKNASSLTESLPSVKAAKRNGGLVMVAVSEIIPKENAQISIPRHEVDHIVVNPYNEQMVSIPQHRFWKMFVPGYKIDRKASVKALKFINTTLKITPIRGQFGDLIARLAAQVFVREVPMNGLINIGVGFPEEMARVIVEQGLDDQLIFSTEAGAYGGLPTPGIFFGAAIGPQHLESSSDMFRRYYQHLDCGALGFLQVDSHGNVNVSKRGADIATYVGPGGFPDITYGAHVLIFMGKWMHRAKMIIENDQVRMLEPGEPKFVAQVDEVTLNGRDALKRGKKIYYATDVGLFELRTKGLTLVAIFPGINVEKDILPFSQAEIHFPDDQPIEILDSSLIHGKGFQLNWEESNTPKLPTPLNGFDQL